MNRAQEFCRDVLGVPLTPEQVKIFETARPIPSRAIDPAVVLLATVDFLDVMVENTPAGQHHTLAPARKLNVGRNAPCPCGSGRKFKTCGLRGKCPPKGA